MFVTYLVFNMLQIQKIISQNKRDKNEQDNVIY